MKMIFGIPIHEDPDSARDLYQSIKKFNGDPEVYYSGPESMSDIEGRSIRVEPARQYRHKQRMHAFLFDIFENLCGMEFDYFIKVDSDCVFANHGFEDLIDRGCDFTGGERPRDWPHGRVLSGSIGVYEGLLKEIGLERKDDRIFGSRGALQVFSKRAVGFIANKLAGIEKAVSYADLMAIKGMSFTETLLSNILKDAGFRDAPDLVDTVRFRPYWEPGDIKGLSASDLAIVYHPVRRIRVDGFRKALLEKAEIYRSA